jgi:hypothetical protein
MMSLCSHTFYIYAVIQKAQVGSEFVLGNYYQI